MRISIAMATYNGAIHLQEQLDSFLAQTRQPDELVVCDDGSTDATLDILGRFCQKASFSVKIIRNDTNLGFTKNFEKALSNCSGDLILLSDQDDVWFANKVDVLEKAFLAEPKKLLAVHDGKLVDEKLVWHGATKLGQVIAGFGSDNSLVMGALTALRREFLLYALPIPNGIVGHDVWLHNIAQLLNTRFVINQPLQCIRRHASNTSNWIASSIEKINRLDVWRSQFQTSVATGYEDRIFINESGQACLKNLLNQKVMFSPEVIEKSLCFLAQERKALDNRNSLLKANPLKRKILSVQMLFRGDYRFFNGIRSFLRDIAR
jgi:cellulose synthase/poly-beta-1,6-N-acetylglucosamine synthase-like glycosyltransferase